MPAKIKRILKNIQKTIFREKKKNVQHISLCDGISPVSSVFGFDRGTPIDRYYINQFLSDNKSKITGVCCEIAEDTYCKKWGHNITKQEILHYDDTNPVATIVGDLTDPETLPINQLDCLVCTQTFNFIYNVKAAFAGACQMLKPGGVLLATVAGLSQISRYDMVRWGDYWRFTDLSLKRMAEESGFKNVQVKIYGNAMSATAFVQGIAVEDLKDVSLLDEHDDDYQVTLGLTAIK